MKDQQTQALAARYLRFADEEVRGRSPLYETFARGVANEADVLGFLASLPKDKRQPNLLLAAVRHLSGVARDWPQFRERLLRDPAAVGFVMLTHATQTNEPARCATLLPVLARLPQPLALIEVGASAGLCLLPDFYGYDFGPTVIRPRAAGVDHPIFSCAVNEATPLPQEMPKIVWRAGLDLNPLDPADPAQAEWLQTLVWPEQTQRLAGLRAALKIGAVQQPRVVKGNLLGDDLDRLCRDAPKDATLVVFHTAVVAYVADMGQRRAFADKVRSICRFWISNEAPTVFPGIPSGAGQPPDAGRFLLSVNGFPVAWTDPHGAAIDWTAGHDWHPA